MSARGVRPECCFVGTRIEALKALQQYTRVVAIATVPESWVHRHCVSSGIDTYLINRTAPTGTLEFLARQEVEIVFSAGCPLIFPESILKSGPRFLNSHPALLPAYKGYSPIKEGFSKGEEFMGVTVHEMSPEVDSGPIIWQEKVRVRGLGLQEIYDLMFGVVEPMTISRAFAVLSKEQP